VSLDQNLPHICGQPVSPGNPLTRFAVDLKHGTN
jgi:hypothetical protein